MSLEAKIKRLGTIKTPDGVTMSLATVPVKNITFNPHNPYVLNNTEIRILEKQIKVNKYTNPVTIFYDKDTKELIFMDDTVSEHTCRILAKTQKNIVVNLIEEGITRAQAFNSSYIFNTTKGQIDQKKLARMLSHGIKEYGEKEVRIMMGLQKYQVQELLAHASETVDMTDEMIADEQKAQLKELKSLQKKTKSQPTQKNKIKSSNKKSGD